MLWIHLLVIAREYDAHWNVNNKICRFLPVSPFSTSGPSIDTFANLMTTTGYCEITVVQNVFATNFREDQKSCSLVEQVLPPAVCCQSICLCALSWFGYRCHLAYVTVTTRVTCRMMAITTEHHYFISWAFLNL